MVNVQFFLNISFLYHMNSFKVSLGSTCIIQFVPTFLEIPKAKSTMILDASVLHRHQFHGSPTSDMIEDHTKSSMAGHNSFHGISSSEATSSIISSLFKNFEVAQL